MRLVLIGAPNSGKGVQSCLIEEKYAIPRLVVNELVRQAVAENTALGQQAKFSMDLEKTIPDDVLFGLIQERISLPDAKKGFIFDGFPTNMDQAQALDNLLQTLGRPLHMVILLDTDFDALMQRITGRLSCRSCGHVCNMYTSPPALDGQCDECGGNLRHRSDDDEEIISNRLRIYENQMTPVIEYYREQDRLRSIQGIGKVDDIFAAIQGVIASTDMDEEPMPSVEALEKIILEKAQRAQGDTQGDEPERKINKKSSSARKAVAKKPAQKKAAVKKKVAAKKQQAKKKSIPKKKVTKKAPSAKKKAPVKKAVKKKTTAKKKVVKKKAVAKKTTVKKKTPASKKTATKKKVAKVSPKKTTAKKSVKKKKAVTKKKKR